jgi:NhaC family Na+:H+ antiporter
MGVFLVVAALISWAVIKVEAEVHMPIVTAVIFVALVGMFVMKIPWAHLEESALNSIMAAMQANMILMSVGILVGVWLVAGIVPGLIYYGLFILKPSFFPLATLLICSIISLATGSSWQTSGTIGIAMLGIGNGLGVPVALTAGVIISGAYFGDKMSPLSDTTNLAPAVSGATLFDHIRAMIWTTGPTYLIVAAILAFMGMKFAGGTIDRKSVV